MTAPTTRDGKDLLGPSGPIEHQCRRLPEPPDHEPTPDQRIADLEAQLAEVRDALDWYGQPDNWKLTDIETGECVDTGTPRFHRCSFAVLDKGRRARLALARTQGGEEAND